MIWKFRPLACGLALICLHSAAVAESTPLAAEQIAAATITGDISIPTPGELMAALNKQGQFDWAARVREPMVANYTSRAQMALNLGSLIADGYIAVEAADAQQVKNRGRDILDLATKLGVPQRIRDRGKSLTDKANEKEWDVLREELEATQNEVKLSMDDNKDQALVDLVTVGAWIRGTEVVSATIAGHYTKPAAKLLRQPAIVAFLRSRLSALPPKFSGDPAVKLTIKKLMEIEVLVAFAPASVPTEDEVKKLNEISGRLVADLSNKDLKR